MLSLDLCSYCIRHMQYERIRLSFKSTGRCCDGRTDVAVRLRPPFQERRHWRSIRIQVFQQLKSDNENERIVASQKLYDMFTKGGGHPDDWEIKKKGDPTAAERMAQRAQAVAAMLEEELKKQRAAAEKERTARAKTEEMLQRAAKAGARVCRQRCCTGRMG